VSKPEMSGARWTARPFCSIYGVNEIFLRDPDLPGEFFFVIS